MNSIPYKKVIKSTTLSIVVLFSISFNPLFAQKSDSTVIRSIYDEALSRGKAYEDLRSLCKDIGARLSGSSQAEMAVQWGKLKLEGYGFDTVYLQEIKVPHWERGTTETGWIRTKNGKIIKTHLLALGGSVGTSGLLSAEVIVFNHLDELKKANPESVKGKIVFINQPMDETQIQTFKAYGGCYPVRGDGAVEAAKLGAIGVLIRSLGLPLDEHPHTGGLHYTEGVTQIPAAALSTLDAEKLAKMASLEKVYFNLEMDCRSYPDVTSHNVIAEITGTEKPNEFISFGGHLDSWDTGEGAHDDGAGIVHCMEALRLIKTLNIRPKHTLRVVFFMNEENGNMGGITYASWTKDKGEKQIAAVESDRGGFAPRGFSCSGTEEQVKMLESFRDIFLPYDLHVFEAGYGGVDITPLKDQFEGIPLFGFVPDSQRYFDFHHAPSDVFENVNKRELELGAAAIASFLYLLDKTL
jgi:carboxypeptidase Q